ncbi:hypothetical protein Dcar01_03612 [Deinococcus carri]|uniref:Uncharacterized protein n=1 Tax=Deinococcus carri TaxID=1211323 RepID=A0ABP9WEF3_9DEIO
MKISSEQTREYLYLGTIEVTCDRITLNPEPEELTLRVQTLTDFVDEVGWMCPSADAGSPHDLPPVEMLGLVTDGIFEDVCDESEDEQARALAREALADGPYTGALYAIGITLVPGTVSRFCDVRPVAFRCGTTWRHPDGSRWNEDEGASVIQRVLDGIRAEDRWLV